MHIEMFLDNRLIRIQATKIIDKLAKSSYIFDAKIRERQMECYNRIKHRFTVDRGVKNEGQ